MISREEAIRILDPATSVEALAEIEYYAGFSDSMAVIKAMHDARRMGVEALRNERPKGRWIQEIHTGLIGDTNEYNDTYFFRCSICGRTVFEKEPYCHCGADMREVEGNER